MSTTVQAPGSFQSSPSRYSSRTIMTNMMSHALSLGTRVGLAEKSSEESADGLEEPMYPLYDPYPGRVDGRRNRN